MLHPFPVTVEVVECLRGELRRCLAVLSHGLGAPFVGQLTRSRLLVVLNVLNFIYYEHFIAYASHREVSRSAPYSKLLYFLTERVVITYHSSPHCSALSPE